MAAPSSAQIKPSARASIAPAIQPRIACGPPKATTMRGMVMNGPMPHIWVMLIAMAVGNLTLRIKPTFVCSAAPLGAVPVEPPFASSFTLEELTGHLLVLYLFDEARRMNMVACELCLRVSIVS